MKFSYDLHIHSALSPCADNDMTPNNIVNMALLNGLDIIAVTDHNSAENVNAVMQAALENGLLVIPGMEFETSEEIHVVCLFPELDGVMRLQELAYKNLPPIKNKKEIFGSQLIMDSQDEVTGENDYMLITATGVSIYELVEFVSANNGIAIPAHIDRDSYSILASLGTVPDDLNFTSVEISKRVSVKDFCEDKPYLLKYNRLQSSDSHNLGDIFEAVNFLDLEKKDAASAIQKLMQKK